MNVPSNPFHFLSLKFANKRMNFSLPQLKHPNKGNEGIFESYSFYLFFHFILFPSLLLFLFFIEFHHMSSTYVILLFIIRPGNQSIFSIAWNWIPNLLFNHWKFYQLSELEPTNGMNRKKDSWLLSGRKLNE